jgi:hypothetical protein
MPNIKPNRDNWREFCEEPKLTDEEYEVWLGMSAATSADDDLMTELIEAVPGKREPIEFGGDDWSDVVTEVDASRRLARAEVEWWRKQNGQLSD